MADHHVKKEFDRNVLEVAAMGEVVDLLSPSAGRLDLEDFYARYNDPATVMFGDFNADSMRSSPTQREKVYDTNLDLFGTATLAALEDVSKAEVDFLAYSTAALPHDGAKAKDIEACRTRLASLNRIIDRIHDDPVDAPTWIEEMQGAYFAKKKAQYVERLGRGQDSTIIRDFLLNNVANEYIRASTALVQSIYLHAVIVTLRLEAGGDTFGDERHSATMKTARNELNDARQLNMLAAQACPQLKKAPVKSPAPRLRPN